MLRDIVAPIGKFIFHNPHKMYNPHPHKRVCVQVDLFRNLLSEVILSFENGKQLRQPIRYLNAPNTCFRCQSSEHITKDYPVLANTGSQTPTLAPATAPVENKSNNGSKTSSDASKEDGWQVVKYKGKGRASKTSMLAS